MALAVVCPVPVKKDGFDGVTVGADGVESVLVRPAPRTTIPSPFLKPEAAASVKVEDVALILPVVEAENARTPNFRTST